MPLISIKKKQLTAVEIIFIMLRLLRFLTQIIESTSPSKTDRIFTPAQMKRMLSVSVILNNIGINDAKGRRAAISAAALKLFNLLFSIIYLISLFPKRIIDTVSINAKISTAHGRKGNILKPVLTPFAVKSCREQETR